MNHVLYDHLSKFVMVYFNDIIIYSKSMMEHVKYLNWILGQETIPNLGKVTVIEVLEWSTTISKLRGFLGVIGFFKKYIQGFGQIAKPLNDMTSSKFRNC